MKILLRLNGPRSGTKWSYNRAIWLKRSPRICPAPEITMFLMADAVAAARIGQKTPDGYHNIERILKRLFAGNGKARGDREIGQDENLVPKLAQRHRGLPRANERVKPFACSRRTSLRRHLKGHHAGDTDAR